MGAVRDTSSSGPLAWMMPGLGVDKDCCRKGKVHDRFALICTLHCKNKVSPCGYGFVHAYS